MTWSQWRELHDTSATAMALERVYRSSPRVRAKLLVATHVSMNQLFAGEAILRQQLSEVVGASVERVQLEFLQTSVLREDDQGEYFASFGISALPDPARAPAGDLAATLTLLPAIEAERERIIQQLRYGSIVRQQNVTIASLYLFGTHLQLLDVALDGETFYQIDFKPWIAARVAVVPASDTGFPGATNALASGLTTAETTPSSNRTSYYSFPSSGDAFQNLRLRFLLVRILLPLQMYTSDIIIRDATATFATMTTTASPVAAYYAPATLLDIEFHVNDVAFRAAVDGYLRNASLAEAFSVMEPQWTIGAIDVDPRSGILYSPVESSSTTTGTAIPNGASTLYKSVELTLALANLPFVHIDARKWRILEATYTFVVDAVCSYCRVRYARIALLPVASQSTAAEDHNDGDTTPASDQADPINTAAYTLSFRIDAEDQDVDAEQFAQDLQNSLSWDPSIDMRTMLGFVETSDLAGNGSLDAAAASVVYRSAAAWSPASSASDAVDATEPFVQLNLTLRVAPSGVNTTSADRIAASVFDLHRIRCALLVLLQQVHILNEHLHLVSTRVLPLEVTPLQEEDRLSSPLLLVYRVALQDESQRRGVAALFLSQRLQHTIEAYMQHKVQVSDRRAGIHADGSPAMENKLPGLIMESTGASLSDSPAAWNDSKVYRYRDPVVGVTPSLLTRDGDPLPSCSSLPTTTTSTTWCVSIQWESELPDWTLFLRQIESNFDVASSSLAMPTRVPTAAPPPAPWVLPSTGDNSNSSNPPWIFYENASTSSSTMRSAGSELWLRLSFEFVAPDGSARNSIAFTLDVGEDLSHYRSAESIRIRRSNVVPMLAGASSSPLSFESLDLFVTADVPSVTTVVRNNASLNPLLIQSTALVFNVQRKSVGGFFNPTHTTSTMTPAACSTCRSKMEVCDASLECRAISACFRSVVDAHPAIYASLLLHTNASDDRNLSWLLTQCLGGGGDGNEWTKAARTKFVDGLLCAVDLACPIAVASDAASNASSSRLVVAYTPLEQTLSFANATFRSTLRFLLDTESDDDEALTTSALPSRELSDLVADDASMVRLKAVLLDLYGQPQDGTTIRIQLDVDPLGGDSAVVKIQYYFLSATATLPYVFVVEGDSPAIRTPVRSDTLAFRVLNGALP